MRKNLDASIDSDFVPKRCVNRSLSFIVRPKRDSDFLVFGSDHDGFEAYISHSILKKIDEEAMQAQPVEIIGLLAGRVLQDARGPYTLVLASHGAKREETEATPSLVGISAQAHAKIRHTLETTAYGYDIIGWYHSHPRFPARFSSVDVVEQSTFKDPNHLGIVISGLDEPEPYGVYRGPRSSRLISPELPPGFREFGNRASGATAMLARSETPVSSEPAIEPLPAVQTTAVYDAVSLVRRSKISLVLMIGAVVGAVSVLFWLEHRLRYVETELVRLNNKMSAQIAATPTPVSASATPETPKMSPGNAATDVEPTSDSGLMDRANTRLPIQNANQGSTSSDRRARAENQSAREHRRLRGDTPSVGAPTRRAVPPAPTGPNAASTPSVKP
jgi:proteasome lid subunit RPN8/RPN11